MRNCLRNTRKWSTLTVPANAYRNVFRWMTNNLKNQRKPQPKNHMPTIIEHNQKEFIPHPEGEFMAVARDTYLRARPNPFKGQQRDKNDPSKGIDEREEITELIIEFLTDHEVDVDGSGKMMPGYVRYTATASVAENSNLRKFLQGWFPALKDEDFKRFDADKLIGRGAYITVTHRPDKKGNIWANVKVAMNPPKGSSIPAIPSDFVRKQERDKREAEVAQVQQVAATVAPPVDEDDGLPF